MKSFEVKALGVEDLSANELKITNGGSIALLICCVAAIALASTCTTVRVEGNNNEVNVGDDKEQSGGTNVETEAEVSVI